MFNLPLASKLSSHGYGYHSQSTLTSNTALNLFTPPLTSSSDPFFILGLEAATSNKDEIKMAYKRRALQYHPDIRLSSASTEKERKTANDEFARINAAYAVLMERFGFRKSTSDSTSTSDTHWATQNPSTYTYTYTETKSNWYDGSIHWNSDQPSWYGGDQATKPKNTNDTNRNEAPKSDNSYKDNNSDKSWDSTVNDSISYNTVNDNSFYSYNDVQDKTPKRSFETVFSDFLSEIAEGNFNSLLQSATIDDIQSKLVDVSLLLEQLETKEWKLTVEYDNICEQILSDSNSKAKVMERLQLQERRSEIKARRKEVKKYLENAQTFKMILQSRYASEMDLKKMQDLLSSTQEALENERMQHNQTEAMLRQQISNLTDVDKQNKSKADVKSLQTELASKGKAISDYISKVSNMNEIMSRNKEELENTRESYNDVISQIEGEKQKLLDELRSLEQEMFDTQRKLAREREERLESENMTVKDMESMSKQLDEKDIKIGDLSLKLSTMNSEMSSLRKTLDLQLADKKEAEITNAETIASLNSKFSKVEKEKNELRGQVEEMKNEVSSYFKDQALRDENDFGKSKEKKELDQKVKNQATKIRELEELISSLYDEKSKLTSQIQEEKEERKEQDRKVKVLEKEHSTDMSTLLKESKRKDKEIKDLSEKVSSWESRFQKETEPLKTKIAELEKTVDSLTSEKKIDSMSYEASLASKDIIIADLKLKLEATNDVLVTTMTELQEAQNYDAVTSHIEELTEFNDALKDQLTSLQEKLNLTTDSKGRTKEATKKLEAAFNLREQTMNEINTAMAEEQANKGKKKKKRNPFFFFEADESTLNVNGNSTLS